MSKTKPVLSGLDVLVKSNFQALDGARLAVLANPASVDRELNHIVDLLHAAPNCTLVKIFAPEHGFRGELQDMESVDSGMDLRTQVPIVSLYGDSGSSFMPSREAMSGIDALVVDLQDVGSRYYTYVQSMMWCMHSCHKAKKKVIVLDRPNPIGGLEVEGSILTDKYRSFCGHAAVTNRHGLTIGEYALLFNKGFGEESCAIPPINCELEVIEMENWFRSMYFDETGLPWVMPSPNMPTLDTAIVYPGACLFEATNISEGRGTTRPFELIGAPYIDGHAWAEEVLKLGIPLKGARLRPTSFLPKFQKWGGKLCNGVQLHVTDRATFQPYRWGLAMIVAAKQLYPDLFEWRRDAYEFVKEIPAIDLLFGGIQFRKLVETKKPLSIALKDMETFEMWFRAARKEFLLYAKKPGSKER